MNRLLHFIIFFVFIGLLFSITFPVRGKELSLAGSVDTCQIFPDDNFWNVPIDTLPVHSNSSQWVVSIGANTSFHMDFGSGTWDGGPIGIPYNVISGSSVSKYNFDFYYPDESDTGPYPLPVSPKIEWGSDHHILTIDTDDCTLYEIYDASYTSGQWYGGSGAIWSLNANNLRPDTWTSADAAGLPILPGLARYEEVLAGEILHALRFTANCTADYYIWPAKHKAQSGLCSTPVPFGARFRLKASYDISGFSPQAQVILQAFKTYGIVLADNGSNWYVSGSPSESWDNDELHEMDVLKGSDFEAVDTSSLMVSPDSAQTQTVASVKIAAIGDYGYAGQPELDVSNLVKGWNPDFIITLGDNNYDLGEASTIDQNIGQYYHEFIYPYTGSYGAESTSNKFFPALGNHDWATASAQAYLDYFQLPGNERYYDYVKGPVHFFVVDSDSNEPDGISSSSTQAQWLQNALSNSTSQWNIVYLHHAPYSSSSHGSNPTLQWPYAQWGADAVLAGHDHTYERIARDGILYFVNGLGGSRSLYPFGTPIDGSIFRYNGNYGAMLITANSATIEFKFIDINGTTIDTYVLPGASEPVIERQTLISAPSQDGWTLESSEISGKGGTKNNKATTIRIGDNVAKKQYRGILSFNTSSLPDDAVITNVTLKVKKAGIMGGGNPINIFNGFMVDVNRGNFGKAYLSPSDFQIKTIRTKTLGAFKPGLNSGWYTINLTNGKAYINKTGNTQIRLRFKLDDNNNLIANFLKLYSGNAVSASRPKLTIEYYVP